MADPALGHNAAPDYYARALSLWPRLDHPRPAQVRYDPRRIAVRISRRTNLPVEAILALLGAPDAERTGPGDTN
jgi:hypothetical protein